jgi:hypothetical protein
MALPELLAADSASLYLWDAEQGALTHLANSGQPLAPAHQFVRPGEGIIGRVVASQTTPVVDDYSACEHVPPLLASASTCCSRTPAWGPG